MAQLPGLDFKQALQFDLGYAGAQQCAYMLQQTRIDLACSRDLSDFPFRFDSSEQAQRIGDIYKFGFRKRLAVSLETGHRQDIKFQAQGFGHGESGGCNGLRQL